MTILSQLLLISGLRRNSAALRAKGIFALFKASQKNQEPWKSNVSIHLVKLHGSWFNLKSNNCKAENISTNFTNYLQMTLGVCISTSSVKASRFLTFPRCFVLILLLIFSLSSRKNQHTSSSLTQSLDTYISRWKKNLLTAQRLMLIDFQRLWHRVQFLICFY